MQRVEAQVVVPQRQRRVQHLVREAVHGHEEVHILLHVQGARKLLKELEQLWVANELVHGNHRLVHLAALPLLAPPPMHRQDAHKYKCGAEDRRAPSSTRGRKLAGFEAGLLVSEGYVG